MIDSTNYRLWAGIGLVMGLLLLVVVLGAAVGDTKAIDEGRSPASGPMIACIALWTTSSGCTTLEWY